MNIRFAVTCALGSFRNDARLVECSLKLTSDPDDEVRDWAVFGLGVRGDADSPEIRGALLRDHRLIPALRTMLQDDDIKVRVAEAAAALLGMDQDPPEWTAVDYRAALAEIGE